MKEENILIFAGAVIGILLTCAFISMFVAVNIYRERWIAADANENLWCMGQGFEDEESNKCIKTSGNTICEREFKKYEGKYYFIDGKSCK